MGNPMLHSVAFRGRMDVLQMLLDGGADPNITDKVRRTGHWKHTLLDLYLIN